MSRSSGRLLNQSIRFLFLPQTLILQIEVFVLIFLCTHYSKLAALIKAIGESVKISILSSTLALCLIFMISQSFSRRERALQDLSAFKSNLTSIYYCFIQNNPEFEKKIFKIYKNILIVTSYYLTDQNTLMKKKLYSEQQKKYKQKFYQLIYELTTEILTNEQIKNKPLRAQLYQQCNDIIENFEKLCAIKDYVTPIGIRAFIICLLYILPAILTPYFISHQSDNDHKNKLDTVDYIGIYLWSWLYFWVFASLVHVKEKLDDIFDGDSLSDDIVIDWDEIMNTMQPKQITNQISSGLQPEHSTANSVIN